MSVTEKIVKLAQIKAAIQQALVAKGVTGAATHGYESFANDILSITTGGAETVYKIPAKLNMAFDEEGTVQISSVQLPSNTREYIYDAAETDALHTYIEMYVYVDMTALGGDGVIFSGSIFILPVEAMGRVSDDISVTTISSVTLGTNVLTSADEGYTENMSIKIEEDDDQFYYFFNNLEDSSSNVIHSLDTITFDLEEIE